MRHILFGSGHQRPVTILLKETAFREKDIREHYIQHLVKCGIREDLVSAFTLEFNASGKASATLMKDYLAELMPILREQGTKYIYVTDSGYFKVLTKQQKAEPHLGYVLPCALKGYEDMNIVLGVNHQALFYKPDLEAKLELGIETLADHLKGGYAPIGEDIIQTAIYPEGLDQIEAVLESLHQYPELSADIEAFSLDFDKAGIATIGFAWDQHNGTAFAVDYIPLPGNMVGMGNRYGYSFPNSRVREALRKFFETYKGKIKWHNCTYDTKVLIYTLWMKDALDMDGLLKGLHFMHERIDDTKIIAYLALNSTARNSYSLKDLAHEFAGNYAQSEINDVRKIPLPDLMKYNLIDCLSTWYVSNKYKPMMIADNQEKIYNDLMMPSQKVLTQVELSGMPMNMATVVQKKIEMEVEAAAYREAIMQHPVVLSFTEKLQVTAWEDKQASLKKKIVSLEDFVHVLFNPGSPLQLQQLLYETLGLPILDYTDTKQPATGVKTLNKLINHTQDQSIKDLLTNLINLGKVEKILSAFIPAFENAMVKPDNWHYLHGSFHLGGTVSGRLSSSNPNMQNIPAGSKYAKIIKEMFQAPPGWLFGGADFASLEDRISALTTKDPNKLKVYTDGFDGHCLRAYAYFGDQMPDVEMAPKGAECYTANVGGADIYFHSEEDVEYLGKLYKGKELYALLTNS